MSTIVFFVFFAIVACVGLYTRKTDSEWKGIGTGTAIAGTVLSMVVLIPSIFYTQDPGEAVVLRSFTGEVVGSDSSSGLGFKVPWVDNITFDIRNQRIEMYSNAGGQGPDGARISAGLTGGSNAYFSIVVRYSIRPDKVRSVYDEYKSEDNLLDREMRPATRDEARNATATYEPFTIKERRVQLSLDIEERLSERWEEIGIVVEGVDIGEITLDEATEQAISEVNVSRSQVESARNNLEASRIEAESMRVIAQADADADQIIRCGADTQQITEVISGKEVETTKVTPKEGDDCQDNLNEQVLTVKWLQTLEILGRDGNLTIVVPNTSDGLDLQPRIDLPIGAADNSEE